MNWFRKDKQEKKDEKVKKDLAQSQDSVREAAQALQEALLKGVLKTQRNEENG